MAFLEAMSLGLIIIAPNNPTYNEYIISGHNGFLYDSYLDIYNQDIDEKKIRRSLDFSKVEVII